MENIPVALSKESQALVDRMAGLECWPVDAIAPLSVALEALDADIRSTPPTLVAQSLARLRSLDDDALVSFLASVSLGRMLRLLRSSAGPHLLRKLSSLQPEPGSEASAHLTTITHRLEALGRAFTLREIFSPRRLRAARKIVEGS